MTSRPVGQEGRCSLVISSKYGATPLLTYYYTGFLNLTYY